MKLKEHEVGMGLGLTVATIHAVWATMVFLGVAQPYLDWILGLHSLANPYRVLPFDLVRSLTLIAVTFVIGYVLGWAFAAIWKGVAKK